MNITTLISYMFPLWLYSHSNRFRRIWIITEHRDRKPKFTFCLLGTLSKKKKHTGNLYINFMSADWPSLLHGVLTTRGREKPTLSHRRAASSSTSVSLKKRNKWACLSIHIFQDYLNSLFKLFNCRSIKKGAYHGCITCFVTLNSLSHTVHIP